VKTITGRAVRVGLVVTLAAGVAAFSAGGAFELVLDVYLLCLGGVVMLALVRATQAQTAPARASQYERALAAMRAGPPEPGELSLTRDLELSTWSAFHLHTRVRPVLREIAAHRLLARYAVDLDGEAPRARELVGASAWELVRPDRPPPRDRLSAGPPLGELRRVVEELEAI
jgi:hypothetical protein